VYHLAFTHYQCFQNLNRDSNRRDRYPDAVLHSALYKPLLLSAVLDRLAEALNRGMHGGEPNRADARPQQPVHGLLAEGHAVRPAS
jgi:hypothetical protein